MLNTVTSDYISQVAQRKLTCTHTDQKQEINIVCGLTGCTMTKIGGGTFKRKAPFATTSFNKGECVLIFEGGPIFERF